MAEREKYERLARELKASGQTLGGGPASSSGSGSSAPRADRRDNQGDLVTVSAGQGRSCLAFLVFVVRCCMSLVFPFLESRI